MTAQFEPRLRGVTLLLLLLAAGCARSVASPASPSFATPPPGEPSERQGQRLAELEQSLDDSEGELLAALPSSPAAPAAVPMSEVVTSTEQDDAELEAAEERPRAAKSEAPPPAPPVAAAATADGSSSAGRAQPEEPPCAVACRALDSMSRAARRICAITGEGSTSCADARARVAAARDRVAGAGCGCVG